MWEFLSNVLEKGGVVALLFVGLGLAFGATIRALWKQNQTLHKRIAELQEAHTKALVALQEKRVGEAQTVTAQVVKHVESVRRSMDKVGTAMDVLIELSSRR